MLDLFHSTETIIYRLLALDFYEMIIDSYHLIRNLEVVTSNFEIDKAVITY